MFRVPNTFDAKDCKTDKNYFIARWLNPNDWDSLYVLYKKVEVRGWFGLIKRYNYVAVAIEYVPSHWGIEASCFGESSHKSLMKADLYKKGVEYDFLKLNFKDKLDSFRYYPDTHIVKQTLNYEDKTIDILNYWKII